jgi:hypothetical protein
MDNKTSEAIENIEGLYETECTYNDLAGEGEDDHLHVEKWFCEKCMERKLKAILAKYKRMEEALKEIEWQQWGHQCYACTALKCEGHWPDCPIGKALVFDPLSDGK